MRLRALRTLAALLLSLALLGAQAPADGKAKTPQPPTRRATVDLFVDSGSQPLAAWQVELAVDRGSVKILSVEGGEHPAFRETPCYDPAALHHAHIVLAAFNTGKDLPRGKTRVARLQVQIAGSVEPDYIVRLEAAGDPHGHRIDATATVAQGEARSQASPPAISPGA
jgi:hypothetical protein